MRTLMRTTLRVCALAAFALASPFAWAQAPGTGLALTAHDFSGRTATPATLNDAPTGACTFCHTPHQGSSDNVLAWNRNLSANTFSWSANSATSGGTQYSSFGPTYTGTSVKCLSCHDGSVAVGQVNMFDATTNPVYPDPVIPAGPFRIADAATGNMDGNHPVAMPYPFGQAANTYNGRATGGGVLVTEFVADPTGSNIRLYNDTGANGIQAGTNPGSTGIECASCHDPHNGSTVDDIYFLRGDLSGSTANYICRKCHIK